MHNIDICISLYKAHAV